MNRKQYAMLLYLINNIPMKNFTFYYPDSPRIFGLSAKVIDVCFLDMDPYLSKIISHNNKAHAHTTLAWEKQTVYSVVRNYDWQVKFRTQFKREAEIFLQWYGSGWRIEKEEFEMLHTSAQYNFTLEWPTKVLLEKKFPGITTEFNRAIHWPEKENSDIYLKTDPTDLQSSVYVPMNCLINRDIQGIIKKHTEYFKRYRSLNEEQLKKDLALLEHPEAVRFFTFLDPTYAHTD